MIRVWLLRLAGSVQNFYYRALEFVGERTVPDISQITDQLWTGGALVSEADVEYIAHVGITADADMRLEFDDQSLISGFDNLPPTPASLKSHPQIGYLYNGVADDGQPKPVSWFEKTYNWAKPIYEGGGVILCHCAAGVNRGPSMTYFLLCTLGGMSGEDALRLLQQKRPVVEAAYRHDADEAIVAMGLGK